MLADGQASPDAFDRLVAELSTEEREGLLNRIRFSETVDEAPLREPEPTPEARFEQLAQDLTFLERLLLLIRRLLTGRDRPSLVEDLSLKRIAKSLSSTARDIFTPRTLVLEAPFFERIEALQDQMEVFRGPLREALGAHKKEFIAFLVGVELPVIQARLMRESEPANHGHIVVELSEFDMRRTLDSTTQGILEEIDEKDRQRLYRDIQVLHSLLVLAGFGFKRILNRFGGGLLERVCPAVTILVPLRDLSSVLRELTTAPSTQVVATLFLFMARNHLSDEEFDLEGELEEKLKLARESLSEIRRFNQSVPLNDIVRIVAKDVDWVPVAKGGAEDWFVLFRQFWSERVEERVSAFVKRRSRRQLVDAAISMLNLADLPYLPRYRSGADGEGIRARYEHSIAFLRGFLEQVFNKELSSTVKVFLLDGKFYKEDNRKEFLEAYNQIERLPERIGAFGADLSDEGNRGSHLLRIKQEESLPANRMRAIDAVYSGADADAEDIVSDGRRSLEVLHLVVEGILHGSGDEPYDTIGNLNRVGGHENRKLVNSLRAGAGYLAAGNEILGGLFDLETEQSE